MIGIFDSGVGGLSVLREIRKLLPTADMAYFADTAHVPYGDRSQNEIRELARQALKQLMGYQPKLAVIACNTATAVAITEVRAAYPKLPIVGVVPVVKTLAERSKNHRVAVVATPATLSSATYAKLKVDYATGLDILEIPAPEWVMLVERGQLEGPEVRPAVVNVTQQIMSFGADVVALGSTHFAWLRPVIEAELPGILVLDSGPAVARQVVRVLTNNHQLPNENESGKIHWMCSGNQAAFQEIARQLLGSSYTE